QQPNRCPANDGAHFHSLLSFDTIERETSNLRTTRSTVAYPRMYRLRQKFPRPLVENIPAAVRDTLGKLNLSNKIKPGQTVALTAGSRGIANIALILKSTVRVLRDLGAKPYLVPAMGSHGGATAEGQIGVLHRYGITEEFCGAPIRSSMDFIELGTT